MTNDARISPTVLSDNCTGRRGHRDCRDAHRAGLPVHVIPPLHDPAKPSLVMPSYHFATAEAGIAAINDALANAPIVATDADLYAYRAAGVAYRLPAGWIDPTRRVPAVPTPMEAERARAARYRRTGR